MKNLAGVPDCDDYIRVELTKAKIPVVSVPRVNHEVAYSLVGQLGEFKFRRAWYYWVVEGRVPLEVAKAIYDDPIGTQDIRVNGHCGCPPPTGENAEWFDADGKKLVRQSEYDQFVACFKEGLPELIEKQCLRFSDDRNRDGQPYITCYHIDTQEGLRFLRTCCESTTS